MSFAQCIADNLKGKIGKLGQKKQEEILEKFENLKREYMADGDGEVTATHKAASEATIRHEIDVQERKKRKLAHAMKQLSIEENLDKWRGKDVTAAAEAFIEMDDRAPWIDYVSMQDRIRGQAHSFLAGLLDKYGNKGTGLTRTVAGLDNVVREIFSPNTTGDSAAATFAKAWGDTVDHLVRRYNAAGGSLMRRKDWNLPQYQSRFALAKAGEDAWVKDHMNWLDWDEMRFDNGSRIPVADREKILRDVFKTLKTNGHLKPKGSYGGKGSIGNRLEQSRFLVFKDADSWMQMHGKYGDGNVFDVMMGHVDKMAHQVALLETFGPNPAMMKDIIKDKILQRLAEKDATGNTMLAAKAEDKLRRFDAMFEIINRETAMPEMNSFGRFMAGTRNLLTSAYLGSASLLAIPGDMFTAALTNKVNGLPAMRTLSRYLSLMNPLNKADRTLAIRSGLIAENASRMAYAQTRMYGIETHGPAITRRFADVVMRLSLMSPHTQAARWAFQMELMGAMAENAGKQLDELPFADMFKRHGITPDDWNTLRSIPAYQHEGASFLRPDDLYRSGMDVKAIEPIADRFMTMIMQEGKYAVPDASIKGLTVLRGASKPGTVAGELLNSFAMFKNFPVTILMTHGIRGIMQETPKGKISYLAAMGLGMGAVGALGIQMRAISQGKDPRDMTDPKFLGEAMLTGGGLGIWGDFLFNDVNRFGSGMAATAAGPVVGFINDARKLTIGNVLEFIEGKETNVLPEAVQFAKRTLPGSSLWWSRLILEREVWDQVQKAVDPKAHSKWKRRETEMKKNYGQEYWWKPGTTAPQRAPAMSPR